ncbi:response regulator [Cohnella sp. REN36]|uniref:response regulator n=1 Tax=Cohnella sp. REN36 TaxID=2887347 RepID=UPI001D143EFA|nr:response regulator [Cohnella sp. REN36]MCC3376311.1 response regulator [Cohnella sp. REN36]
MRAILVDDEYLALTWLQRLLRERGDCEVIGSYLNAEEAIEEVGRSQPDIVFMDILMPGMNGMQATARIREISPETEVIFTTGHNEYALTAFGLEVLDYIMKPVTQDRLEKTMRMLQRRMTPATERPIATERPVVIHCMGALQVRQTPEQMPIRMKFRTAKIKELFAYLLHHRSRSISKDMLLELLWPDLDEQKGLVNLHTSIHRLRGILNEYAGENKLSIRYVQNGYLLEGKEIRTDTEEWESQLSQLPPLAPASMAGHRNAVDLYEGAYFGEDNYVWAEAERRRLQALWLQHARQLAQYYAGQGMDEEALAVHHRIQQFEPLLEDNSLSLMRIYDRLGDAGSVESQYNQLVAALRQEAGIEPGREIEDWYWQWKEAGVR